MGLCPPIRGGVCVCVGGCWLPGISCPSEGLAGSWVGGGRRP